MQHRSSSAVGGSAVERLRGALAQDDASGRLQAALSAGTYPQPEYIAVLIERSGVEPDFPVRDMLTWALTRHPAALTVPALVREVSRQIPQARSQSLHTLSKIADPTAWPVISDDLLADPHDEVARTAWRAAVAMVPAGAEEQLARSLAAQLGRPGREVQLSLSRALAALGEPARGAVSEALERAQARDDEEAATHALATERLIDDPDEGFESALHEARRTVALRGAPATGGADQHDDEGTAP